MAEALALRLRLWLGRGAIVLYLSAIVLLPLAAVLSRSLDGGLAGFWDAVSSAQAAQTEIDGYRDAALALADRYEQAAASRLASA